MAFYMQRLDFLRLLAGLRGEYTVIGVGTVYVDGPTMK